jgi:hypothetical protein
MYIYSRMFECPNLEDLRDELMTSLRVENDFRTVSERITEKCYYFMCHKSEQKFACNDGKCRYNKRLDKDLRSFYSKLERITAETSL